MTESEEKALAEWLKVRKGKTLKLNDDGIDCVVEALTEVQAYRATELSPELIEAMKGHNIALINDLGEYQQIGTIERFRELTEKAEPKKLVVNQQADVTFYHCPRCNELMGNSILAILPQYCRACGQRFGVE